MNRGDQLIPGSVLQKIPRGTCPDRSVNVLIGIERAQQKDPGIGELGPNPLGGLQSINARHAEVHQYDVGPVLTIGLDDLQTVFGKPADLHRGLEIEQRGNSQPHDVVVVG
jgi:hypothetical protein